MAKTGFKLNIHGSFKSKEDAVRKERAVGGWIKTTKDAQGRTRYTVFSKREDAPAGRPKRKTSGISASGRAAMAEALGPPKRKTSPKPKPKKAKAASPKRSPAPKPKKVKKLGRKSSAIRRMSDKEFANIWKRL